MKKMFLIAAMFFAGLFTYCYGQDVKVNINNQDYSSNKDCEYKINGICSSEDIGGVEISGKVKWEYEERYGGNNYYYNNRYAVLTNYNSFTVTVLYEDVFDDVNSVVLRANETKEVLWSSGREADSEPKRSSSFNFPLKGMIVRKVG